MKKVCAKGHDMAPEHKRCPTCGGEGAAPAGGEGAETMAKSQCAGCGAEAGGNFCNQCGEPLAKSELGAAELESALNALDTLAKANANLASDLEIDTADQLPELAALEDTFAKAAASGEEEAIDAAPILHATVSGLGTVFGQVRANGAEARQVRLAIGTLAKSVADVGRGLQLMLKSVSDRVEAFGAARRPARSITLAPHEKSLAPGTRPEPAETALSGHELMAKCQVAFQRGHLSRHDLLQTETYVGLIGSKAGPQHANLDTIRGEDASLAGRIERGIAAITQ